uniref:tRNA-uridine aminocarboxypropyltransferase n=1 Tax=Noctiluca scintillans TaxID=2966 RepID=A0A7S1F734_NOCSC|mmetsp:Transcript_37636/g.100100  ORF Transcript_37636/g.100100 Transcript_37636/m.100100 type:complete len:249 (+) Transcript_37636:49-795(+)
MDSFLEVVSEPELLVESQESTKRHTPACGSQERPQAIRAWQRYTDFVRDPGRKCRDCWLMAEHCCCAEMPKEVRLRPKVILVMHYRELEKHLGSNTAKLLLHFGAELFAWGVEDQDARLAEVLAEDVPRTAVLFPSPDAVPASSLVPVGASPSRIVVLDGGWNECKRINEWIDPCITRCVVTTATREEFGGTRKYGGCAERVQTAAAFAALLSELGEDTEHVAAVKAGLSKFMKAWETQIRRSKTHVT